MLLALRINIDSGAVVAGANPVEFNVMITQVLGEYTHITRYLDEPVRITQTLSNPGRVTQLLSDKVRITQTLSKRGLI